MKNTKITAILMALSIATLSAQESPKTDLNKVKVDDQSATIIKRNFVAANGPKQYYTGNKAMIKPLVDEERPSLRKSVSTTSSAVVVKTFPNPFTSELIVNINDATTTYAGYEAILLDMQGKKIFSQELVSKINKLNLNNLNAGMYVLHVQKNGIAVLQEKVIKQ